MHEDLTDEQLRERTAELLGTAESLSLQLKIQNERLAAVVEAIETEIVSPIRKELGQHGDSDR